MTKTNTPVIAKQQINFGHLGVIFLVAVLLVGFSWLKDPQLFSFLKARTVSVAVSDVSIPHYVAYVQPAEFSQPMVAGANTQQQGPMILNEDGTMSPAIDPGEVLGVSTEDYNLSLNAITVKTIPDSGEATKKYLDAVDGIEQNYMNNLEFETAISSGDQKKIDAQLEKVKNIIAELQNLPAPESLAELHKNKILQYNAAVVILQNYTNADDNPELVSKALGIFLEAQTQIENLTPNITTASAE